MQIRGQSASRYPHHQRTQLQGTGCLFPRACLPACLPACLSVSLSVCVSGHPLDYQFSLFVCISPCVWTSAGLSVQSVYISLCLGIRRTISLVCLCVILRQTICSVCLRVVLCLSVCVLECLPPCLFAYFHVQSITVSMIYVCLPVCLLI